jgi:hypothetical protein
VSEKKPSRTSQNEPEHSGSVWSHPYMIYILLTALLAVFLGVIAWLALQEGWLPQR